MSGVWTPKRLRRGEDSAAAQVEQVLRGLREETKEQQRIRREMEQLNRKLREGHA